MAKKFLTTDDLPGIKLWLALDMEEFEESLELTLNVGHAFDGIKVHGVVEDALREKVSKLKRCRAKKIWYDRKVDDTPGTVKIVALNARRCGVDRMTIMASAGIESMMAARTHGPNEIVAVTDLTSLSKAEIGMSRGMPADASVLQKAQWARLAGIRRLVCSIEELPALKKRREYSELAGQYLELQGMQFIVPGSRTITDDLRGQQRSDTAMATIDSGANELVIGSEVWNTDDPVGAQQELFGIIKSHLESK